MGALKDFFLVLMSPGDVFERIREKPTWWVPFIILIIATIALTVMTAPIGKEIGLQQIEKKADQMTAEQLAQTKQMLDSPFMTAFSMVAALITVLVSLFIQVGVIHFVLSAMGGNATMVAGLSVVLFANVPMTIRHFVEAGYAFKTHELMKTGIAGMFPDVDIMSPMAAFLGGVDIFAAWQYVLLAIGCSIVYKVSKGKAAGLAFGMWAAGTAVTVGMAFMGAAFGGGGAQ
jgi:hypothetical protein